MTMHRRRWSVVDVATAEELAVALTGELWCSCNGFRFGGYLWLNDATGPDGAQEYAVVRERNHAQVESVTFGWVDAARGLAIIREIVAGDGINASTAYGVINPCLIETPVQHRRCVHCA
jgi:stage V sporulation protein SpoVS